jgi:hypothetical protein
MIVTFYKEWTNEYGHKFKVGETVELWSAKSALRARVCVLEGQPFPEDIAEDTEAGAEVIPFNINKKKGNK